ncbi:MAG: putative heme-binding domain-containing protein [Candidatus Paceibacteria bacterium]|jgi:putative heme-binding domain-containing protein
MGQDPYALPCALSRLALRLRLCLAGRRSELKHAPESIMSLSLFFVSALSLLAPSGSSQSPEALSLNQGARVVLAGNGLGSRMLHFGHFETELQLQFPEHHLVIRNMCDEGNTPSFRPHSGRADQLGFPGAEAFYGRYADGSTANGVGHFETEEQWLTRLAPDVLILFFGFNESFGGMSGLASYSEELDAFLKHTKSQAYNGQHAPELVLVSPTAYEDRSASMSVPSGVLENANLAAYTAVMERVAHENDVRFVNAFNASIAWYEDSRKPLTGDGALLNDAGYRVFSSFLLEEVFGTPSAEDAAHRGLVEAAVLEKNWFWITDFKMPNGVHVFGRRYDPFGPANYPFEIEKIREMTVIRDGNIWAALDGESLDLDSLDSKTSSLPPVTTNDTREHPEGLPSFLTGEEALATIQVPEGYKLEQWATEVEFPDLANPVQLSFDNQGRLWVAVMPSYPHYRPGDPRPDDKLLILEDTDGDGKADKQTVFADGLHLPMGFEFAPEGVYLSQGINLVLLRDRDGDDHADEREIIFSGFDDHDTHHAISAYCADPSGAILMCEGTFLRSNVETAFGPVRGTNGGFFRFAPQRRHLERHAQLSIPNPWGIAFDDWGQHFFLHTSGPTVEWMLPGSVKPRYGVATPGSKNLIESAHRVRPTSGVEFVSSRHFPDEVQGDMLLNNSIGFLGTKQHRMMEEGTGFDTRWRQDLTKSSDANYRPVDLEFAPDGSLYLVDWHNPLIGHMQHNARDPHRDHDHGRIYRITYPSRPLVEPAKVHGASIAELLENLKLPEYRTRYRTKRELRGRDPEEVLASISKWVASLDPGSQDFEHQLLEALWVSWGLDRVDEPLLRRLLKAEDHRARAAAVRVLRYSGHVVEGQVALLSAAAADEHGRVKMEAITAASWVGREAGLQVLSAALPPVDETKAEAPTPAATSHDGGRRIDVQHPALANAQVQSIRMTIPGTNRILNLAELEIFSAGTDIAGQAVLSQSSEYNGGAHPVGNLVDGNKDNFSHTSTETSPWVEARFAQPVQIDKLVIWNRPSHEERFNGAKIEFFGANGGLATCDVQLFDPEGPLGDAWLRAPYRTAQAHLKGESITVEREVSVPTHLQGAARDQFIRGAELYSREGHCATCHQPDGLGLQAGGFPPIADTPWSTGDEGRLIKLTLNGLLGPMEVKGKPYPGLVPMTPFGGILKDQEIADVLTYVRNSFGNHSSVISPQKVAEVRVATQSKQGFYSPEELEGGAASSGRSFVKLWTQADFAKTLERPLSGRSHGRGQEMFSVASCNTCHNIQGQGANVGADLSAAAEEYSASELLQHILKPSAAIKEQHRLFLIELAEEELYSGLIVDQDANSIEIAEALQEPDTTVILQRKDILSMTPLDVSPMPTGLLVTLTEEEILDLLAYIEAKGDASHKVFLP